MNALAAYLYQRFVRNRRLALESVAERTWIASPGARAQRPRAIFFDGHLERVLGVPGDTTLAMEHARVLGAPVDHDPTRVFELRDVLVLAGSLFAGGARIPLVPAPTFRAPLPVALGLERAALACSWSGNRYFAHRLIDDSALNLLARAHAGPVTVARTQYAQEEGYARLLGTQALRLGSALVRSLLVFDDHGQNPDHVARVRRLRTTLRDRLEPTGARGVMVLRGTTGARRVCVNERELARRLEKRGFRVVEPERLSAEEIARVCLGASCVVGVEGSELAHAVLTLREGGSLVVLQPPRRFNNLFKDYADGLGFPYGFVVGFPEGQDFRVDCDEVERLLDLVESPERATSMSPSVGSATD